ncbi:META domain-containing protein [Aeromonas dhakensis]|uniref:META domain-containing protein n=1 Tax=Aeromonas dhakensis TaxID=196024 RepID=UPI00037BE069|nr:META domain-containing protein [Aeromonas dhakensis]ASX11213.1 META domain-containing protein [Aeromonas dhakensis]MBL0523751.1 META domain-containing protein [Aeromonas dhakensis]BEE08458.1 META domain-containing protein [Aeromonas dhakensis]BEE25343.1 META domain-containing protein [Aeromonas dhakensis]
MNKKLTLLAALALGGCAMATGSKLTQLQASTWQLQGASGDTFTLQVAGDKVAGKGGCNRYFGSIIQQGDGVLALGPMGSTRMMCMGELAGKEMLYLQTLEKVASFQISGQQLVLSDANKAALLTFDAMPAAK